MSVALYRRYSQALKATPMPGRLTPYDWVQPRARSILQWLPYEQMLNEFAHELANSLNEFTALVHSLGVWAEVIKPLMDRQKHQAVFEFIQAPATVAVNLPHVIKARLIFATAHLCHQANQARLGADWVDDLPLDDKIYLDAVDQYGAGWRRYPRFKRRLEALAGRAYRRDTHDFRNAYNHRFSPRFVMGFTHLVTRAVNKETGRVTYGFGGQDPLDLAEVVALLAEERDRSYAAFQSFQELVAEHEAAITAEMAKRLGS
jgi:hypothetical protein